MSKREHGRAGNMLGDPITLRGRSPEIYLQELIIWGVVLGALNVIRLVMVVAGSIVRQVLSAGGILL